MIQSITIFTKIFQHFKGNRGDDCQHTNHGGVQMKDGWHLLVCVGVCFVTIKKYYFYEYQGLEMACIIRWQ